MSAEPEILAKVTQIELKQRLMLHAIAKLLQQAPAAGDHQLAEELKQIAEGGHVEEKMLAKLYNWELPNK